MVPAGMPRKPGQTRDDLFEINADIAKGIVDACAKFCPTAVVALIVNPVNSIVPAMAELFAKKGLDPIKIVVCKKVRFWENVCLQFRSHFAPSFLFF